MSTEKSAQQKKDLINSLTTYFKGVKAEWSKISWPVKQQVIVETGIVLAVVTFFTIVVYVMDIVFDSILKLIK